MKTYTLPASWDAGKFAARYGLNAFRSEFWTDGKGTIFVPDNLPDDPPVFDLPDSPLIVLRNAATQAVDGSQPGSALVRAVASVIVDALNAHALKINAILGAVDAATSLADLKTRIAAIPDLPPRTLAQVKTAIKAAITAGSAD